MRVLLVLALLATGPDAALAQYSSGGYRRPSTGYSSQPRRSPSAGSYGYSRPSTRSSGFSSGSAGDRALSRSGSGAAFDTYRQSQRPPPMPPQRRPSPSGEAPRAAEQRRPAPSYGRGYGYGAPSTGGVGQTLALWALLNSVNRPGSIDQFRNYQSDPEYRRWRAEADAQAARDPAVADKLRQLDQGLQQSPSPPPPPPRSGGFGMVWLVIVIGGGVLVLLWFRRRQGGPAARPAASASVAPSGLRVGMTFPADPSPFLLAAGVTQVKPPPGEGNITVEAVGTLRTGSATLYRLYLPGRAGFFQLHAARDGALDECRYFSQLDEVTPADQGEWAAWLDPAEGMIGWSEFQTKDGKTYGRAWTPGEAHIAPVQFQESVETLQGSAERELQAMLYGANTGAAPPAPSAEYLLVCAVGSDGQAWVEIHAGIDVNPAALSLPSVPLTQDGGPA